MKTANKFYTYLSNHPKTPHLQTLKPISDFVFTLPSVKRNRFSVVNILNLLGMVTVSVFVFALYCNFRIYYKKLLFTLSTLVKYAVNQASKSGKQIAVTWGYFSIILFFKSICSCRILVISTTFSSIFL